MVNLMPSIGPSEPSWVPLPFTSLNAKMLTLPPARVRARRRGRDLQLDPLDVVELGRRHGAVAPVPRGGLAAHVDVEQRRDAGVRGLAHERHALRGAAVVTGQAGRHVAVDLAHE